MMAARTSLLDDYACPVGGTRNRSLSQGRTKYCRNNIILRRIWTLDFLLFQRFLGASLAESFHTLVQGPSFRRN
jgi:hypothetical protein